MPSASVVSDPKVMMGKPVIAGTRITIESLLEKLSAGEPVEQILRAYPHLPEGSISVALAYAAAVIRNETIVPLERRSA